MMTRSYGWNLQRLQHSRNNSKLEGHSSCKTCAFIGTAHIVCGMVSVSLSHFPAAAACGGFDAVGLMGGGYRSIAAPPAP